MLSNDRRIEYDEIKREACLVFLRKRAGLSQQELAEKLYLSRQSISKWESGTGVPSTENLVSIGKLFHVSLDVLLDDEADLQDNFERNPTELVRSAECRKSSRINQVLIAICVFLLLAVAVSWSCTGSDDSRQEIPMEELERDRVDISSTEEFHVEPLQP